MIAPKTSGESQRNIGLFRLSLVAILVGAVTGFGAIGFRGLIGLIHNLFFLGRISFLYDANTFTPVSPWGIFVVLVPVVGALIVTLLVTKFAPEARGHGVPEVMDAVYYSEGRIRPMVAAIKSLASSLSIGSGAAVGREGPIIQIGASLGSTIGQIIPLAAWQRITLVAAGAGSGIAATFNTPIGGVMFAVELMMPEVSVRTFLPVALATGTATFIARLFIGLDSAFETPLLLASDHHAASFYALLLYAFVGYALLRVRRPEVAEDLVQETLYAAVRTHSNFEGKSSERSWLCGILKNKICDYFRKLGRETNFTDLEFLNDEMSHKFIDQGWNHDLGPAEWESETEALMDRAEFWATFRDCLSKLPARVADVFMLREMEETETAQICQALRISQNNLWVMLHRARMALRECLELNWFENKP